MNCKTAPLHSAIYTGKVRHRRFSPRSHEFSYRIFMLYLDLAETDILFKRSRLWSTKPALAWFRRQDYLAPHTLSLDQAVRDCVEEQTGQRPDGAIRLLTNLRYFGTLMNPISCYYCFDSSDTLRWIVAEVTNTPWRERRAYVIPCEASANGIHKHRFNKSLHVSPFMPMDMQYHWRSNVPDDRLTIHLQNWQDGQQVFNATLNLRRESPSSANLNRVLLSYPFMSARTALAIYWQALRLFLKRVPLHAHKHGDNNRS